MKGQGLLTRKVQMKLKMIQVDDEVCAVGLGHFVSTVLSRLNGTTKNADVFNRRIMGNPYSVLPNLGQPLFESIGKIWRTLSGALSRTDIEKIGKFASWAFN